MKIFAERLCDALAIRGLTITELAEKCGVSRSAIDLYCKDKGTPKLELFCKMAKVLEVSTDYLVGFSDDKPHVDVDTFEKRLRYLKRSHRVTCKEIEAITHINEDRYRRIEYSRANPTPNEIIVLAKFYNVSIDYLLCGEGAMQNGN